MEWHINDLSLCGQFADPQALRVSLEPILRLRQRRPDLRSRILCSRSLYLRPATAHSTVREALFAIGDRLFKRLALEWLANGGPFWDDSRAPNPDDYFQFEDDDVTEQGLGEAARRRLLDIPARSFSFLDPPSNRFRRSPLVVVHGLQEEPLGQVDIVNVWTLDDVEAAAFVRPSSWPDLFSVASATFDLLIFSREIPEQLRACPFHAGVAERILELLKILQFLASKTRDDSSLDEEGLAVHQKHFVGDKAQFSDESDDNKRTFCSQLTFSDPLNESKNLFCPWHGKVKIGQYRLHFEWPRPKGQRQIKVVYIGPKITKR